jgi:hypothetical protein
MDGREVFKQNEELLRGIVRTIDKNLEYSLTDESQEQRFSLKLSARGRHATVSLSIEDLRLAGQDLVRKNTIRQKIKNARDHMMDSFVVDVTGKKMARMLKQSAGSIEESRRSNFRRSPRRP